MKAIHIEKSGGSEVLQVKEFPDLQPDKGEMIIDVAYAGVGLVDVLMRNGDYPMIPFPMIPGIEVSGFVRSIGDGVVGFKVGEPVVSMTMLDLGGYATQARVRPHLTISLEQFGDSVGLEKSVASIINLTTAYMAIQHVSKLQKGETILIHSATGGLGSFLGQIAKKLGAKKVLGTVGSLDKVNLASSLGYDELFIREDFVSETKRVTEGQGIDIIIDPVGGETRKQSLELLKPLGKLIFIGNSSGDEYLYPTNNDSMLKNHIIIGFGLGPYAVHAPNEVAKAAREALQMIANNEIKVDISGIYPLEQAAQAHLDLESRKTTGKLLLKSS
ncbi:MULTISPECIES: quinone oxidoreductase family protein [Paenibacillus]|uniref:NADPH:quinone reductase-like Zn-dependent oxidoreductase n=1 Tax=Paenibacillus brasilensis TaxID=128574 RepID=A0ABU0L496_9BACL|nr:MULTISPECIES: zinc-binding dehydrogenase [Paenibacillus]MDQ0496106.1 NADPH:quinone reductase-like Zn-dependent oxidoreductase [Paenibacillus brasilensis]